MERNEIKKINKRNKSEEKVEIRKKKKEVEKKRENER